MNAVAMVMVLLSANVADGDAYFENLEYPAAIQAYEQVLERDPENAEALWKLSRAQLCLGDIVDDSEAESHYRKSEQYARRCVELNDGLAEGHVWLAAALGSIAMFEGSKSKVKMVREIKKEIDRALELNPNDDAAYSLLGSFHRAIGGVSWIERNLANLFLGGLPEGGYELGEIALKRAIGLRPDVIRHQFELGMLYWEWGKKQDAIEWFKNARQQPIHLASDRGRLRKIERMLGKASTN